MLNFKTLLNKHLKLLFVLIPQFHDYIYSNIYNVWHHCYICRLYIYIYIYINTNRE